MKKYSVFKIMLCIHLERLHRRAFDFGGVYDHLHKIVYMDYPFMFYYKSMIKIYPDYRKYLSYWKPTLDRAYVQKRVSPVNLFVIHLLKNINHERYTPYSIFDKC